MFSTTKANNKKLIAEDEKNYIYLDKDAQPNTYESDSKIELIPNTKGREIFYITGSSGAGKSTLASNYVRKFIKLFPKSDIFLFSRKDSDPAFDDVKKLYRIKIDDRLLNDPIDILQDLKPNTLMIFDDIDTVVNPYYNEILRLINEILEVGRQYKIYGIITSHLINPNNKKFSRTILNESDYIAFFKNNNVYGVKYFLKNYGGLDDKKIKQILDKQTRPFIFHKHFPNFIITDKEIFPI